MGNVVETALSSGQKRRRALSSGLFGHWIKLFSTFGRKEGPDI